MRYWILAIIVTLTAVVFQRITGPTYPIHGKISIDGSEQGYRFNRSHTNDTDCPVVLETPGESVVGTVYYRRYKTDDEWIKLAMRRERNKLVAELPRQPAAGKLQYYVELETGKEKITLPSGMKPVVVRFKNPVPLVVLIPHIIFMFTGMLISNRAGLECLRRDSNPMIYAKITFALLCLGGLVLGPIVQLYAFGDLWTGFPFGIDLTDNKTLIAVIFWLIALIMGRKESRAKTWVLVATVVTILIFSIPHSTLGSEYDYNSQKVIQAQVLEKTLFIPYPYGYETQALDRNFS